MLSDGLVNDQLSGLYNIRFLVHRLMIVTDVRLNHQPRFDRSIGQLANWC